MAEHTQKQERKPVQRNSNSKLHQARQLNNETAQEGFPLVVTGSTLPLAPKMIMQLQRIIGNRAVIRLMARDTSSEKSGFQDNLIQRGIRDDIWSWVGRQLDKRELRDKARELLKSEPVDVAALLKLIRGVNYDVRRTLYDYAYVRMEIVRLLSGEDLVEVMSAILDGNTYTPGWQSVWYHGLPPEEKETINERVDRWFKYTVGVDRALDPKSATDMPLVRHWLRYRDTIIETDIARTDVEETDDEEKRSEREKSYEEHLRDAIEKMKSVDFGSGLEVPDILSPDVEDPFEFWDLQIDEKFAKQPGRERQGKLVYNQKATPGVAVDELFQDENLKKWSLDCAEFTQAAHLYARRHTLGDQMFAESVQQAGQLTLRMHYSSDYKRSRIYQRNAPNEWMTLYDAPGSKGMEVDTTIEELLEQAPIGSRIVWRNKMADKTSDFYNENTIKMGTDEYVAHGFPGQKYFTRDALERKLAETTCKAEDGSMDAYIQENVFIRTIEHVQIP